MTENRSFRVVGIRPLPQRLWEKKRKWYSGKPIFSILFLILIFTGCLTCEWFMTKDPAYLDLRNCSVPPGREFLFGTDTMGRDIFSMIWYGGRASLFIGLFSNLVSTGIAVCIGAFSGCAPAWLDELLMRFVEIMISVPGLLIIILVQAVLGPASVVSISFVIGITGWTSMAKVIRTEVRQIRGNEHVIAARCMGGGFFHILWKHLAPNFLPSIMFMAVMNMRSAIAAESTLSFMGIGLPLEVISWGSMLSLSEKALSARAWWIILIPGIFLAATLLCITGLGNYLRKCGIKRENNLS
ncbi:MAG: ABC transporter permease [Lachnospiraceae bacterium]|jgi:peptide/nickel transport system permease protein|nr:ABC transporter permease [Lachnospiraceae bacterium]